MAVKFPWGRWKTPLLISHPPPVKADSNVNLLQIQTTWEPHLRNHPDFLIDMGGLTPNVGSTFCEQPTSKGPGRRKVVHLLFHWPFLSLQVDLPHRCCGFLSCPQNQNFRDSTVDWGPAAVQEASRFPGPDWDSKAPSHMLWGTAGWMASLVRNSYYGTIPTSEAAGLRDHVTGFSASWVQHSYTSVRNYPKTKYVDIRSIGSAPLENPD